MCVLSLQSCTIAQLVTDHSKRETKNGTTLRFDGKKNNIRDYINIDGVFVPLKKYHVIDGEFFHYDNPSLVFHENGAISAFFTDEEMDLKGLNNQVDCITMTRQSSVSGIYSISSDSTLKCEYVKKFLPFLGAVNYTWEWFTSDIKIISRDTLKCHNNYNIAPDDSEDVTYVFVPAKNLPFPYEKNEAIRTKWMWSDIKAYKNYMDTIKLQKLSKERLLLRYRNEKKDLFLDYNQQKIDNKENNFNTHGYYVVENIIVDGDTINVKKQKYLSYLYVFYEDGYFGVYVCSDDIHGNKEMDEFGFNDNKLYLGGIYKLYGNHVNLKYIKDFNSSRPYKKFIIYDLDLDIIKDNSFKYGNEIYRFVPCEDIGKSSYIKTFIDKTLKKYR